ncbi:uncharacterized protein L969DRAFT_94076 [Mixia osmundae IAM 14324]|uniref:Alkaline phosphatase n=1 Tax=Mixia osmundae (strain CBS 9802 / IAM 14324 / JCM 22182 / KY 12970) TaxID=764103 RepID=G7E908_MIXOS|nr:uncharacterized protein L969DRAFT_94076 [Mixia osmundae IAM 14324]KEI40261.1 hypothetical protein L969DRAFT_94076 [Mixia osmundae IAM 14324]GAA99626.1 hypothetical protein E5Q_06327 [Mixia osmundae IAM 14324]
MRPATAWTCLLACIAPAANAVSLAELESNVAYKSPSLEVRALEVPLHRVHQRLVKRGSNSSSYYTGKVSFPLGIASGDPYQDGILLWTMPHAQSTQAAICLTYAVSKSSSMSKPVATGKASTTQDVSYSYKVIVSGLQPYTQYYYQFTSCAGASKGKSQVGRFKTLPSEKVEQPFSVAFFSCSNWPAGWFNSYGDFAKRNIDYSVHLGDYIYEYAAGDYGNATAIGRAIDSPLNELATLKDYEMRHRQYKTDPDSQAFHAHAAHIAVWDDHEVADNSYKAGSADSNNTVQGEVGGLKFSQRKANAVTAYYRFMPIRQVSTDDKLRIYRTFRVGKLATLVMLDTRHYDRDLTDLYYNTDYVASISGNQNRSIMGTKEEHWLYNQFSQIAKNGTQWPLIGQQVVFANEYYDETGFDFDYDAWSGYKANAQRLLDHLKSNKLQNTIILSGDSHANWVNDITRNDTAYDPVSGKGSVAVEFAGTAVSSPSSYGKNLTSAEYTQRAKNLTAVNPFLKWAEGEKRGYFALNVTKDVVTSTFYAMRYQNKRSSEVDINAVFHVDAGANRIRRPVAGKSVTYGSLGQGGS